MDHTIFILNAGTQFHNEFYLVTAKSFNKPLSSYDLIAYVCPALIISSLALQCSSLCINPNPMVT